MALVVGTSFSGGFFVAIGADLFACTGFVEVMRKCLSGGGGNDFVRAQDVPAEAWGLVAAFVVLGVAGWYVQTRSSPARQQTDWNPAYFLFGANLPSALPPVWFQMPANKATDAAPPPAPAAFSYFNTIVTAVTKGVRGMFS
ncbi:hypothetical protein HDU98_007917 [Podochytrium sp. JEL0797]|nr:hypothetical protein HDU98_007917 [Podochytrium sp. JEL0797]